MRANSDIRRNGNMVSPEDLPNAVPFREGKMLKKQQLLAGKAQVRVGF